MSQENRPFDSLTHSQAKREDDESNHDKHKADDDSPGSWSSQVDGPPYAETLGHEETGIIVVPVEDTQLPIAVIVHRHRRGLLHAAQETRAILPVDHRDRKNHHQHDRDHDHDGKERLLHGDNAHERKRHDRTEEREHRP